MTTSAKKTKPAKSRPRHVDAALNWTGASLGSLRVEREHTRTMRDGTTHKFYADVSWDGTDASVVIRHRAENAAGDTLGEPNELVQLTFDEIAHVPDIIAMLEWSQQQLVKLTALLAAATNGTPVTRARTIYEDDES